MRQLLFLIMILWSCEKPCDTVIVDTYSNYNGYWEYCRYASNEINSDLVYVKSDTLISCDQKDTVFYKPLNCPRSGTLSYTVQLIVR